jgi:hypothetical protein
LDFDFSLVGRKRVPTTHFSNWFEVNVEQKSFPQAFLGKTNEAMIISLLTTAFTNTLKLITCG